MVWALVSFSEEVMEVTTLILIVMKTSLNLELLREGICKMDCFMVLGKNYSKMVICTWVSLKMEYLREMGYFVTLPNATGSAVTFQKEILLIYTNSTVKVEIKGLIK